MITNRSFVNNDDQHDENIQKDMADRLSQVVLKEIKEKRNVEINISTDNNEPIDILTNFSFRFDKDLDKNDIDLLQPAYIVDYFFVPFQYFLF